MKIKKKVWPEYFQKILDGKKTYELRLADWECNEGDILVLQEWDPETKDYTGREIEKEVNYLNKRARKIIRRPGAVNAFELNNIVKKIRDLRTLLISLAKAAAYAVKTLWLRFVHGVM